MLMSYKLVIYLQTRNKHFWLIFYNLLKTFLTVIYKVFKTILPSTFTSRAKIDGSFWKNTL